MRTHRSWNRTPDCLRPREGQNECVLCEMERHNRRLALTMRFHTKQGGDRVIRWHVSKCDFSAPKTKVAHSPDLPISLSLCLTLLYQVSKSFSICSEPDVISDLENQVFWVISFTLTAVFVVTVFWGFIMYSRLDKIFVLFRICNEASKGCFYKNCSDKYQNPVLKTEHVQ